MDIITGIDILIAVLLIGSVISGYMTGLVARAAQLAAVVASYVIATVIAKMFSSQLGSFIYGKIPATPVISAGEVAADAAGSMAYSIIFAVVLIIAAVVLGHLAGVFKIASHLPVIGKLDRLGGAIAGFITSFIIIYLLSCIFFAFVPQETLAGWGITEETVQDSLLLKAFY